MQTLNPKIVLQNLVGNEWLICIEHDFGSMEKFVLTVRVPKGDRALSAIKRDAFARATLLLNALVNTPNSNSAK